MRVLVGNTGLIGLTLSEKIHFDLMFNSRNIQCFHDTVANDSELYLSCLPATKWIVNQDVLGDLKNITDILDNIRYIRFSKVFLFSTIDVYQDSPRWSNEDYAPNVTAMAYGSNRLVFEHLVRQELKYDQLKIVRLPALYSKRIKKNILFDLLNNHNVDKINFNSSYQWYNLNNLVGDLEQIEKKSDILFNLFPEPIYSTELLQFFPKFNPSYGKEIVYNYTTKHTPTRYTESKERVLEQIGEFVNETMRNKSSMG